MYFSRASASCSLTLLAIGERAEAGLMTEALANDFPTAIGPENVATLLVDAT
jgi:hypothetical protein